MLVANEDVKTVSRESTMRYRAVMVDAKYFVGQVSRDGVGWVDVGKKQTHELAERLAYARAWQMAGLPC